MKYFFCKFIFLFLIVGYFDRLPAQTLNIAKKYLQSDSIKWATNITLGGTLLQQGARSLSLSNSFNLVHFGAKNQTQLIAQLNRGRAEKKDFIHNGFIHLRYTLRHRKKLSYELFSQAQYDHIRRLSARYVAGTKLRYHLKRSTKLDLALASGMMYESENWLLLTDSVLNLQTINSYKSSSYIHFHTELSPTLDWIAIIYYQARWDNFFKPRVLLDSFLVLKITKKLSINLNVDLWHDANPIVANDRWIYELTYGLGLTF
ncbi:DUF481 domain-containing protein [Hugenholtzia roseola]|uniref:DUF481 domain-containing protein n=1 Tax=Hugenholtzia roseola TaxID=1002 RepID=UPI000416D676|nr:DUF481 domain-containing protein [Hugenholtzia roseola]